MKLRYLRYLESLSNLLYLFTAMNNIYKQNSFLFTQDSYTSKIYLSSAYNYKDNVFRFFVTPLGFSVPTPWTSLPPLALVWTSTPRKIRTASSWKMPRNSSTLPSTHFYYWYVSFLMSMHVYMFLLEVGLGADECVRMWKQRECFIHYLLLEIQFLYIYFFNWDEQKVTNFYVLCIINKN